MPNSDTLKGIANEICSISLKLVRCFEFFQGSNQQRIILLPNKKLFPLREQITITLFGGISYVTTGMRTTEKTLIVLEDMKGKSVSEICTENQISQSQYYQWHDQFLANASKDFEEKEQSKWEAEQLLKSCVAQLCSALTYPKDQGRTSLLGISPDLGLAPFCLQCHCQQETG